MANDTSITETEGSKTMASPSRAELEAAIETAIETLNEIDIIAGGDPDLEEDNEDFCEAFEDDFSKGIWCGGPGDPDDAEPDADSEPDSDDEPDPAQHDSDSDDEPDFANDYRTRTLGGLGHPSCFQPFTSVTQLIPELGSDTINKLYAGTLRK